MLPVELNKKLTSFIPGQPKYEWGTSTQDVIRRAQDLGILTDRNMAPATGLQQVVENMAATGVGGGLFGAALRAPKMISAGRNLAKGAAATSPLLREQMRQLGMYDVLAPMMAESGATPLEQAGYESGALATRLLAPTLLSGAPGMRPPTDVTRTEGALRRAAKRTGDPLALRSPSGAEVLKMPVPEMVPVRETTEAGRTAEAYRKAKDLMSALRSPEGARNLAANREENLRRIQQMPFESIAAGDIGAAARSQMDELARVISEAPTEGMSAAQMARATEQRTRELADGLLAQLPGSGKGFEAMADSVIDLMKQGQAAKNADYAALGDMTRLGTVSRDPLYQAWEQILKDKKASAALAGGLGDELNRMKEEMDVFLGRNIEASAEATAKANAPFAGLGITPRQVVENVKNDVSIADLVEQRKYINSLKLTPTGDWIRVKLINAIDDTIGQNKPVQDALQNANSNYAQYRQLIEPNTPYGKAFEFRDLDRAKQYLTNHIRQVFAGGDKTKDQADELADLFGRFSTPDELQNLFRGALADTITFKANKIGALPTEVATNIKGARGELNAARSFAERIGIPRDEMDALGVQLAQQADKVAPRIDQLTKLSSNPRAFLQKAVTGQPEDVALVQSTLQDLGAIDPDLAKSLNAGIQRAVESQSYQKLYGTDLGELAKDPFMYISPAVGGRPEQKEKVLRGLEAAMPAQVGPTKAALIERDIAKAEQAQRAQQAMDLNLRLAAPESSASGGTSGSDLANLAAFTTGVTTNMSPYKARLGTRVAEYIGSKVAHPLTDMNLYGRLMSDADQYLGAITANPLYAERGVKALVPQMLGAPVRAYSPQREMGVTEPQVEAAVAAQAQAPEIPSWDDEEVAPSVQPAGPIEIPDWD